MQEIPLDDDRIAITGALDFDRSSHGITPRRLPAWTRPQIPAFMEIVACQSSGVRIEFNTDAQTIELDICLTRMRMGARGTRSAIFDLVCDGELISSEEETSGHILAVDLSKPGRPDFIAGEPATLRFGDLPKGLKRCEIWLPTSAQVELRRLRVDTNASVQAVAPSRRPMWVHYGSSISHCSEATSPTQSWPAVAAKLANADLLNLGLGGNCQLDQFVARTIRELPADLISLKLGINIVNMDSMRERTFAPAVHGFLDTIREAHPTTPILIVSPIYCPSAETNPGPTLPNEAGKFETFPGHDKLRAGCLTLTWIRKILTKLVISRQQAGDANLHYLDGLELFNVDDAADLPDDLHPNGAGYTRMGQRFHKHVFTTDGAFAKAATV